MKSDHRGEKFGTLVLREEASQSCNAYDDPPFVLRSFAKPLVYCTCTRYRQLLFRVTRPDLQYHSCSPQER